MSAIADISPTITGARTQLRAAVLA